MSLPKVYNPGDHETNIYSLWEEKGAFAPLNRGSDSSYSIVVPPPNANGNLHLGHGLTLGLEDIAVRYHRMKGEASLLLPGADHAGFETQSVYEKELQKAGKSRFDLSREELYAQIWDFVGQNKDNYESQFRRIGASVDWSRYTYTLDEKIVKRAYTTFKKMWDEGLIYRGERLVNFCTFHGTGFADIEVEYKDEASYLWYINYQLADGSGHVTVATTRPETMLGDTAVAVHPDDERYTQFHGKTVKLPLTNREIPIITDDFVDKEFGTGAVKITPAHDPNDYEAGKRHDLPFISVINHEGKISSEAPAAYRGLDVLEARKLVVQHLKEQNFLDKEENYNHSVGHCYKCGTVIQPLLREQWFIDMKPLAEPAIKALQNSEIQFYPSSKKRQLINYYQGLKDWNISRQIAWGIPIPAFQNVDESDDWIYDERVDQEIIELDGKTYHRDPDVFDTWFSSSSWPYATLDYPDGEDFNKFYPLSVMETGVDLLQPWVSRMIMFGLYVTGKIPFEKVYFHGMVLDQHGQKMSKSKGNVVNPMDKIAEYGSDALRLGLLTGMTAGTPQPFGDAKLVGARNFCNKLWNVARFVETKLGGEFGASQPEAKTLADHWMLYQLQQSIEQITAALDDYRFSDAADAVYHLLWDDFADWYIEASKAEINQSVLAYGLETILKLAHPFVPFVSEAIWQSPGGSKANLLITSTWPVALEADAAKAAEFEEVKTIVSEVRNIKSSMNLGKLELLHSGEAFLDSHATLIAGLAKLSGVRAGDGQNGLQLTNTRYACWLDIDEATAKNYVAELNAKLLETQKSIAQLEGRLGNQGYVEKAPKHLIEQTEAQLADAKNTLTKVQGELTRFS